MKKTTIKISLLALALCFGLNTAQAQSAQAVDIVEGYASHGGRQDLSQLPKMEKDIIILQNVLGDLFSNNEGDRFFSSRNAKGMYIPGSGVMFSLNSSVYGSALVELVSARERESQRADRTEEPDLDVDEMNKKNEENLKQKSREFLANYGSLLSELKSGEKIMLNIEYSEAVDRDRDRISTGGARVAYIGSRSNKKRMQSSISAKTLSDFTSGKISLDQAMNSVEVNIKGDSDKEMSDVRIMAGILDDLLQNTMDGKLRRRSRTSWSYFDGFGLMFNIQMSTTVSSNLVVYSQGAAGTVSRISKDDRDKEREEMLKDLEEVFPEFEEMLKENIIQYGRTLRSLGTGESIIVNVDLGTYFRDSKLPRSIRMVIPKSTIEAYAKGQKSLDQAKQDVDITRLQTSIGNNGSFLYRSDSDFFPTVYETAPEPATSSSVRGTIKSNK
ncbi:hypothetical protein [Roseivirga sp.]|uniref:hypothetical protein n=1 Tax=Roseivirga sp. TaxID=1964215 RepID=UPI003B520024